MSTVIEVRSCFISSEKLQYIFVISKPHRALHDQDHADHIDKHQSTDRSECHFIVVWSTGHLREVQSSFEVELFNCQRNFVGLSERHTVFE